MWRPEKADGKRRTGRAGSRNTHIDDGIIFFVPLFCSSSPSPPATLSAHNYVHHILPSSYQNTRKERHMKSSSPRCRQAHLHLTIDLVRHAVPLLPQGGERERRLPLRREGRTGWISRRVPVRDRNSSPVRMHGGTGR